MTGRSVKEWIGKTPDTKIPTRIKVRLFKAHGGKCHVCKRIIQAGQVWEADHVQALCINGENRESNLAPAHDHCHEIKTKEDVKAKARADKSAKRHLGLSKPKGRIQSQNNLTGEPKLKAIDKSVVDIAANLQRRPMFK